MHPNAGRRCAGCARDAFALLPAAGGVDPGIDPMHAHLAAGSEQFSRGTCDIIDLVRRRAHPRCWTVRRSARRVFRWNEKECRAEGIVDVCITIEIRPEVLGPTEIDEG